MARKAPVETLLYEVRQEAKHLDASAPAAEACADADDRLHRRVGLAILKVKPARGILGIEAIVGKDGTGQLTADGGDPELSPAIEPANEARRTCAQGAQAVHEDDRGGIIEARHGNILAIRKCLACLEFRIRHVAVTSPFALLRRGWPCLPAKAIMHIAAADRHATELPSLAGLPGPRAKMLARPPSASAPPALA